MAVAGVVLIRIDGDLYPVKKGSKITFGGYNGVPQMANGEMVGHANDPTPGELECTVLLTTELGLAAFNKIANFREGEIQAEADTGAIFSCSKASRGDGFAFTGGEGEMAYKATGKAWIRIA